MAVDVTTEMIVIARRGAQTPVTRRAHPDWYVNNTSARWQTPPVGVRSRLDLVARFLGQTLAYTHEVVECGPHRLMARTARGPFPTSCQPTIRRHGRGKPP